MKKLATIMVTLFIIGSLLIPTAAFAKSDLTGHYFEYSMTQLIDQGIIGGFGDGSYRPDKSITRAEFTAFLIRSLGLSTNSNDTKESFSDVKRSEWYYYPIEVASNYNLVGGYSNGQFKPNANITREQMAALIARALKFKGVQSAKESLTFKDSSKISPMFKPSIQSIVYLNIMAGTSDELFSPKDYTTRGQTSAVLLRMLNQIKNPKLVISNTKYNVNFDSVVNTQMNRTPKADGTGVFIASRKMVEYYANPNNFEKGTDEYLQFLDLSKTTNITASEINQKVLTNVGTLSGQGSAFIKAGSQNSVNEIYLIAHALHETGNGKSTLAKGIPVNDKGQIVDKSKAKYTVYNFFGLGAYDSNPINDGAKNAFERKWFTPEAAIIGGASEIVKNYISAGQNTLYKMRWNPDKPGTHQYATHTVWAVSQTKKMDTIYGKIDNYIMKYDVPNYQNQPGKTSKPTGAAIYHVDTSFPGKKGKVTVAGNLNFREGPTTSFSVINQLANNTTVTINGENGGWYNITASGKTGWVSGNYIDIQVSDTSLAGKKGKTTVAELNFRDGPSTGFSVIGKLKQGTDVTLVGELSGWYKIKADGKIGWVSKSYVEILMNSASIASLEKDTEPEISEFRTQLGITKQSVLLQSSLDPTNAEISGDIAADMPVTVIDEQKGHLLISIGNDMGWVLKETVQIYKEG